MIRYLEKIFSSQAFNFRSAYCITDEKTSKQKTQLYTSSEFDVCAAFSELHFANMKLMFEGEGAINNSNKFVPFKK